MAITELISGTTSAISGSSAEFTTTSRGFWLIGSNFNHGEFAEVLGIGSDGETFERITNANGPIRVTRNPNRLFVDLPAGTYQIEKTETDFAAGVAYEGVS